MPFFRKKPVVIDAVQFDGSWESAGTISEWMFINNTGIPEWTDANGGELLISTLEGEMTASRGDWIIKGVSGEFYPCKPDIFALTYEPEEPSHG